MALQNGGLQMSRFAGLCAPLAVVATLALASCAQDVKISSPRYALVYGVATYQSQALDFTVFDAEAIQTTLAATGWNAGDIRERENASVTKSQIQSDILSMKNITSDSTLFVYFSGHGVDIDSAWQGLGIYPSHSGSYIVPYDAVGPGGLTSTTAANLISPAELSSWFAQIGTKNIIVVLDCCNSAAFGPVGSAIDTIPQLYGINDGGTIASPLGTAFANFGALLSANASASGSPAPIVISAAGSLESSYDGTSAMQHGVFTYYFLQAAVNGDANGDGVVTTTEAYACTASMINSYWNPVYQNTRDQSGLYMDFYPHISGGGRDLVLFVR
jgi:hypothetical protein